MNSIVYNNTLLNNTFVVEKIGISYAKSVKDLGTFKINKILVFITAVFKFLSVICFKRPSVIYFQPSITGITYCRDLVFILLGKFFGIKFILHLHGKGILEASKKNKLTSWLYKIGINKQYIIVLSSSQKNDISFLKPKIVYVVNNGIDSLSAVVETDIDDSKQPFRFLFLSNLLKSKGIFDLLEAAKSLKNKGCNFIIDIVGNEGDINKNELMEEIKIQGLVDFLFYHGPKYDDDKTHYFQNADAFVFPTKNEAFGLVLLEAMQYSLPIIATDEGAIPEIVEHGKSGYVYKKNDKWNLQDYMAKFIKDPLLAKEFGIRGRAIYLEKFTIKIFEQNMLNVFNATLNDLK